MTVAAQIGPSVEGGTRQSTTFGQQGMQGRKKQGKMAGRVQPCGTAWLGVWVSQVGREVHRRWVLDCLPAALTSWVPQKVRVFGGMKVIWRRKVLFLTQRAGWGHRLAPPPPGLAAKC